MVTLSRSPAVRQRTLIILASGAVGATWTAPFTGLAAVDRLWSGLVAAGLAYAVPYAPRRTILVAAGASAVLAPNGQSLALLFAAVLVSVAGAARDRRSLRWGTTAAALLAFGVLRAVSAGPSLAQGSGIAIVVSLAALLGVRGMSPRRRRRAAWVAGSVVSVCALAAMIGSLAALSAAKSTRDGIDLVRLAQANGTNAEVSAAVADFGRAQAAFEAADRALSSFGSVGRLVPGLSQQIGAARSGASIAADAAGAGHRFVGQIDLGALALSDGAVDLARFAHADEPVAQLEAAFVRASRQLAAVDRSWLAEPVSEALDEALIATRSTSTTVSLLHSVVQNVPELLGEGGRKRYLVLFTTPVEARNRWGFPGVYAVVRFDDGKFVYEDGGPITELNPGRRGFDQSLIDVSTRALAYANYGVTREWRSVTMPIHGPAVASLARQLAAQTEVGPVDGVVMADPLALAEIIGLLGGVELSEPRTTVTRDNAVDFITRDQYLRFPELGTQAERKDLLTDIADEVGERLESVSLTGIRALLQRFRPLVRGDHLVANVDPDRLPGPQGLLNDAGIDGSFPPESSDDVLYVGHRNNGGNKIDLFLDRRVDYRATVDADGRLVADLTVELRNSAPAQGLPFYLIGSVADPTPPLGTNRGTVLVYSPHRLTELEVGGDAQTPPVLTDGGLYIYQVQIDIPPGQTVLITARLEGSVAPGRYRLDLVPGGLLTPDSFSGSISDRRHGHEQMWDLKVRQRSCGTGTADLASCG